MSEALKNLHLHVEAIITSPMGSYYKTEAVIDAIGCYDDSYFPAESEERHWHQIGLSDREFLMEGTTHTQENYLELVLQRFHKYYPLENGERK